MSDELRSGTRTIRTDYLARVEGEGAMFVKLDGRDVQDVKLRIYEPPRFFEAFLRGRAFTEAPDITARICGICPVAYQMSAVRAMEDACGIRIDEGPIRDLRRLLYCGEWIESHSLHVYMLHAPDFLGYPGAIEMARDHRKLVEQGLQMKKAGNALMALVGGREVHPINVRVGGFYRIPTRTELRAVVDELQRARETALATVRWAATLPFPDVECDPEHVALSDPAGYPVDRGRIVSDRGLEIEPAQFNDHIVEEHVEHSTALHARIRERGSYLTGPLARYSLASGSLRPLAAEAARDAGLGPTCRNPFRSIIVRAVELVQAADDALAIIDGYERPDAPAVEVQPRRAVGHGATEAPRGMLYHRYEIDDHGTILDARIVPPTSQNQLAIRNHDPCISCSTHFLELTVDRGLR
jgi:coenzyme F420-reducing hydrogenase alpha subunit